MSPDKYKRKCGKIVGSEYGTKEVDFMNQNSFNRFHECGLRHLLCIDYDDPRYGTDSRSFSAHGVCVCFRTFRPSCEQIFLPKAAGAQEDDYLRILAITWRMASEIQQMIIHIRHRKRDAESCRILERYISYTDYVLNLIQEMLHLKKEKKMKNINGVKYQRYIKDEPELSRLMNEYAHNLSGLYALVLKTCRG